MQSCRRAEVRCQATAIPVLDSRRARPQACLQLLPRLRPERGTRSLRCGALCWMSEWKYTEPSARRLLSMRPQRRLQGRLLRSLPTRIHSEPDSYQLLQMRLGKHMDVEYCYVKSLDTQSLQKLLR